MKHKRLFLFAGYDKSGVIDPALIHYTKSLSEHGDIVLVMDCDCSDSEFEKLAPYCLYTSGIRHGEYDFGSYKRAYTWAAQNLTLSEYEYVYLVNDSVYGPLYDIAPYLEKMESLGCDAFGLVANPHKHHPHIQSWFIGTCCTVFLSDWFDTFMRSITKLKSKGEITSRYEQGFSKGIIEHNLTWQCLYTMAGRGVYNKVKKLYKNKMPFLKRVAFSRNHGALGGQLLYILNHIPDETRIAILASATRIYGMKYIDNLLTRNPVKIFIRRLHHALYKLFIEGI